MDIAGMKTDCGNYIIDSIVDVGPTFLDSDIKKELTESDLYIPINIYNEMEATKMQLNGTVQNSCGALEIKKEVKSKTSCVNSNMMMMETRLKTRSRSSIVESDEVAVQSVSRNTLRSGRTRNGRFRFDDSVERPYMCSGCNKTYLTSQNLTQHKKRSCSGRKGYTCHQCNRSFFTVSSLTLHSKVHWDPQIQFESAEASCMGLKKTGLLQVKKLGDNKEEKYMCDVCGKMFAIKYALTLHKMIHMSEMHVTTSEVDTNTNLQNGTGDRQGNQSCLMSDEFETNRLVIDEGNGKLLMTNGLDQKSPVANGLENTSLRTTGLSPVEKQMAKSSILDAADRVDCSETSGSFSCSLCDLSFVSKTAFDNHQVTHKHSKIRQLLQEPATDIERDEKGTFYYTLLADKTRMTKTYTSVSDPNAVVEATANGDRFDEKCVYICQLCKMGFHVYSMYLKHMQKHTMENLFLCGVCGKGFQTVGTLSVHMKIHTDGYQSFKCTICDLELSTLSKLTHHKATTHMHRVYECDICGKGFFRSWHLKEHRANHTENEAKECDVCGTTFPEIGSLRKHMWSHLKEAKMGVKGPVSTSKGVRILQERAGEQAFPCDQCPKVYHSRNRLVLHKRTHTREKLSKCDLCDKEFFSPSELNRHQRTHTGEKPFQCGECGKSFALATTLKDHIRSHTGEKPFKCFMCNKSYSSSSILGRHKLTHIGKRNFKCNLCDKSFLYNASLHVHRRTHSGEKPYTCEVCNKSFTMLCHYRVHTRIHTGERPYQCPYCDKDFNNYGSHYKHIRKHPEFKDNLAVDNIDALSNVISMMESDQLETEQIEEIS
ncbi:zinc finger protein 271-like [Gigantopelta aegis]|uniref:zinc finger protein 271-like n=1 Tax=Gigantopelta aegis TaxID=1735272 RepID=UPI001B88ACEF|nr:zinc finger protein 271-like [Gigantopelta aegis]